ncbi:MAG: hypothetical protein CBD16_08150 [Betaproteobacteria bacterium TMED156]|nr:MAG: hypothetical protein CBD16_08150 [Betaproteobacteria bacterium TMED156]
MKHIVHKNWNTGSDKNIDFYEMLKILKDYVSNKSKIFIGTDSFISNQKVCFATAICLYGGDLPARYFFFKEKISKKPFSVLVSRITEETRRSVEIGCMLMEEYNFNPGNIELHLDVSPFSAGNATSKFSDMLKGYVQGYGFGYRLKPEAWASQSIADKHSK